MLRSSLETFSTLDSLRDNSCATLTSDLNPFSPWCKISQAMQFCCVRFIDIEPQPVSSWQLSSQAVHFCVALGSLTVDLNHFPHSVKSAKQSSFVVLDFFTLDLNHFPHSVKSAKQSRFVVLDSSTLDLNQFPHGS